MPAHIRKRGETKRRILEALGREARASGGWLTAGEIGRRIGVKGGGSIYKPIEALHEEGLIEKSADPIKQQWHGWRLTTD